MITAKEVVEAANKGQGCLGKAAVNAPDMPVFVLCAGDELAHDLVAFWRDRAETKGVPEEKLAQARMAIEAFEGWQKRKLPD